MAIIDINTHPSDKELRWFGVMLLVFVAVVSAVAWRQLGSPDGAQKVWAAGGAIVTVYLLVPPLRRWIFVGWMYLAFPLGWTVSHLLLITIYYLVLTPIGLLLRFTKGDPLERRFNRSASSYWAPRESPQDVRRYFRQF